jgi:hypothetical protein
VGGAGCQLNTCVKCMCLVLTKSTSSCGCDPSCMQRDCCIASNGGWLPQIRSANGTNLRQLTHRQHVLPLVSTGAAEDRSIIRLSRACLSNVHLSSATTHQTQRRTCPEGMT